MKLWIVSAAYGAALTALAAGAVALGLGVIILADKAFGSAGPFIVIAAAVSGLFTFSVRSFIADGSKASRFRTEEIE